MTQQQLTQAPGKPIGYAPIYGPPPLASDTQVTPPPTPINAPQRRWVDGLIWGGVVGGAIFALTTWGVLDSIYAGADIRGLERAATAANATAAAADQRATNAEANAQEWQQHAAQQQSKIDQIKEVLGCK